MFERFQTYWKVIVAVSVILGILASVIAVVTYFQPTPSAGQTVMSIASTTSSSNPSTVLTSSLTTSGLPSNPYLIMSVKPQFGFVPGPDNNLLAIVPQNESVILSLEFNNTGNSQLDFWCCWIHIQYIPSSLHENSTFGFFARMQVLSAKQVTYPWTYGTNLPHFPGWEAKITFTCNAADGSWQNSKTVTVLFTG